MREIVVDTETTGLDLLDGHRVGEIGAVELVDRSPTARFTAMCARNALCRRTPSRCTG
jgi:DNA polymerase III epsilon subunit-like protein